MQASKGRKSRLGAESAEIKPESFGVLLLKKGASGAGARKGTNGFGEPLGESSGMGMRPPGGSSGMRPPSFSPA